MLTGLLLLPVGAILVWLYWYLLPGRKWLPRDSIVLLALLLADAVYLDWVERMDFDAGGPLWPYIVSAGGAYAILVLGLAIALTVRRSGMKSSK